MSLMFNGIGASRGIAIGAVHLLQRDRIEIVEVAIPKSRLEAEVARFECAVATSRGELQGTLERVKDNCPEDIRSFIETHLLMLADPALGERPAEMIREQRCNAEWALKQQRDALVKVFESMDDPYLRTRRDDVDHVVQSILRALHQIDVEDGAAEGAEAALPDWRGKIVIADELTPADTVLMQHQGVAGFATESGGQLSHTAILARSLGIPAVLGVHSLRRYLRQGEEVVIDGKAGMLLASPSEDAVTHYRRRQRELKKRQKALARLRDAPSVTLCGEPITLQANIEVEEDIRALRRSRAAGVGLYRTEFMYMNRSVPPDEDEHYKTYLRVVRALKGAPLTIRTVDLGADKETGQERGPLAHNPALGLRGIRRCLSEPAMFIPQLRAILRAAAKGPVNLMFPMITSINEVHQSLALVEQIRGDLRRERLKFGDDTALRIGGMIEVPAAAVCADEFADALDFLSIGTNDLIQYTLAIDRVDDQVNYLYDPLHPAVLQLIRDTIRAGERAGIPVSLCGEMAAEPRYVRLLLALGLRNFSMPPNLLLEIKSAVNATRLDTLTGHAEAVLTCNNPQVQQELLDALNALVDDEAAGEGGEATGKGAINTAG